MKNSVFLAYLDRLEELGAEAQDLGMKVQDLVAEIRADPPAGVVAQGLGVIPTILGYKAYDVPGGEGTVHA